MLRRNFLAIVTALSLASVTIHAASADMPKVSMKTNLGEIVLELNMEKAPKSVANFVQYVKSGFYNGTIFHRVINNFMIQGGGYDARGNLKPTGASIENEAKNGLRNRAYTIAMARTSDPNSANAQFFINTKDNRFLDYPGQDGWGYAVFGKVIKGTDVIDKIEEVETGGRDKPVQDVVIESVTLIE